MSLFSIYFKRQINKKSNILQQHILMFFLQDLHGQGMFWLWKTMQAGPYIVYSYQIYWFIEKSKNN